MILYITRKFPPSVGGMQRFNYNLVSNLRVLTEIKLISWGKGQWILPVFFPYAFIRSLFTCLTNPIECIYVSDALLSPLGLCLKVLCRKKTIASAHGRDIVFKFPGYQQMLTFCLKRLNKVICVSEELKQECLKLGVNENALAVIPNGVDSEDFNNLSRKQARIIIENLLKKKFDQKEILITVGRLVPKKGIDHFLENIFPHILVKFPNIIYLIAGEGPLKEKLELIIKKKQYVNNVFLLGNLPMHGNLLEATYKTADVFVMPNIKIADDMEGFGIVALEAGACGTPVVASNVDGIPQAIQNEKNGFLIDPSDYSAFTNKVCELLSNSQDRMHFSQKAQNYIKVNYSWSTITQKYLKLFRE